MGYSPSDRFDLSLRRRELFRLSVLGGFILTSACKTGEYLHSGSSPRGVSEEKEEISLSLSPGEYRALNALCDTLYPGTPSLPPAVSLKLSLRIDEALYFAPEKTREQFRLALRVLEYGGVLIGYWGRFSQLPLERRKKALKQLLGHPIGLFRTVGVALKQVVQLYYYTHPATWKSIGYEGPFLPEKPRESSQYYQELLQAARMAKVDGTTPGGSPIQPP